MIKLYNTYIACPYYSKSIPTMIYRANLAAECMAWLLPSNSCIAPTVLGHRLCQTSYLDENWPHWYNFSLSFLKQSKRLLLIQAPGYLTSDGVRKEFAYAKSHKMPIFYITPEEIGRKDPEFL
jgi:hypothetical protein